MKKPSNQKAQLVRTTALTIIPLAAASYVLLGAGFAFAQVIDQETSTPVRTSTIDNGSPSDIEITEDGLIILDGQTGAAAVTLDSDNDIVLNGVITALDTNDIVGVVIEANRTGDFIQGGDISFLEDYVREDVDEDEDLDGPVAIGNNRIGILLEAGAIHTGDLTFDPTASIIIEGNNSAGVILGSEIIGDISHDGIISIIGDDAIGIDLTENLSGDLLLSGSVSAQGDNAIGVSLGGDIGGNLTIESTVSATGFTSTGVSNYIPPTFLEEDTPPLEERIDAEDLNDGGPAFAISGSIANGLLVNGGVDDFVSQEDLDDETKDTIEDYDENRSFGTIRSTSSAPALLISPDWGELATEDLVIGTVTETVRDTQDDDEDEDFTETLATFEYDQGLVNRGSIVASGLNSGFSSTALQIEGSADGSFVSQIVGGIDNSGSIQASAADAEAVALDLRAGAIVGTLENSGLIDATSATYSDDTAIAIQVAAGAELTTLQNSGTIRATTTYNAETATSTAILDSSGTLTDILNTGTISAAANAYFPDDETIGVANALDLSATASDISLIQEFRTPTDDVNGDEEINFDDVSTPLIQGNILLGSGNDFVDIRAGTVLGDTDFGSGNAEMRLRNVDYGGDVRFGAGSSSLLISNTDFIGDLHFTSGNAVLIIESNSRVSGDIFAEAASLDLMISDSELFLTNDSTGQLQSLSVTGDSILQFNIDPRVSEGAAYLQVSDLAQIDSGVVLRPVLETITSTNFTQTLISGAQINFLGELDDTSIENIPFIYNIDLLLNVEGQNTLDLEFRLKTADELGLDLNQSAAYSAVLEVFSADDELGAALATITSESEFQQTYNLLLPQRTDASTRYLASLTSASTGALNDRLNDLPSDERSNAWIQEYFTQIDIDPETNVPGYNGSGIGLAAGFDRRLWRLDRVGVFATFSSGRFEEKTGGANPVTTTGLGLGAYVRESVGPFQFTASGQIQNLDFFSDRNFSLDEIPFDIEGEWEGLGTSANASVTTELRAGNFYARPSAAYDYLALTQDAYTETGNDLLATTIGDADTETSSVSATTVFGANVDAGDYRWAPEMKIGYRHVLSYSAFETKAAFLGGAETFDILSQEVFSDALLAGLSLNTGSDFLTARFGYDAEISDEGIIHYGGATLKLRF